MKVNPGRLYNLPEDFFSLGGNVVMKLSVNAAIGVCELATRKNIIVARVEGGIWSARGFEARLDCIWDSKCVLPDKCVAQENNIAASEFIRSEQNEHNAFIVTIFKSLSELKRES